MDEEFDWNPLEAKFNRVDVTPSVDDARPITADNIWIPSLQPIRTWANLNNMHINFIVEEPPLAWYQKDLPYAELPQNVREELLTWALCYRHSKTLARFIPREIFMLVCSYIKTDMPTRISPNIDSLTCLCDIVHCYECTRPENIYYATYPPRKNHHNECVRCKDLALINLHTINNKW